MSPRTTPYFQSSIDHMSVALQRRLACVTTPGGGFHVTAAHPLIASKGGSDKIAKIDGAASCPAPGMTFGGWPHGQVAWVGTEHTSACASLIFFNLCSFAADDGS